jgi:hypothetical protein
MELLLPIFPVQSLVFLVNLERKTEYRLLGKLADYYYMLDNGPERYVLVPGTWERCLKHQKNLTFVDAIK